MQTQKFTLIPAQSSIEWVGKKVTGSHNGTIAIKEGYLIMEEGRLSELNVTVAAKTEKAPVLA